MMTLTRFNPSLPLVDVWRIKEFDAVENPRPPVIKSSKIFHRGVSVFGRPTNHPKSPKTASQYG